MRFRPALTAFLAAAVSLPALAAPDLGMINRIEDEGLNHSQVMQTAEHLTDQIGGRLTNSPAMRQAESWTQAQFKDWGLSNVHKEGFEFGRGWWMESASARMVTPRPIQLRSIPITWTPATNGPVTAPIIVAPISRERDFAAWKGKLAGKIVLITFPKAPDDDTKPVFSRYDAGDIAKMDKIQQPNLGAGMDDAARYRRTMFSRQLNAFLKAEGAVAYATMSARPGGLLHGTGSLFKTSDTPAVPGIEIGAEDYRRLARLAALGPVTVEINSNVHFTDDDSKAYNSIADIPGSDPKAGYVMAGAHLDSWVAADGATDNAAGSAVVMEAARILRTIGVKPKRTIRFALWAGEEQGLWGSNAYVRAHLATRPLNADPKMAALNPGFNDRTYPIIRGADYGALAAYFNIDNGSGKLRGIYAEGNFAAVPLLKEWMAPFKPFDADTVVASKTGSTDHVYMQTVGLPGFQFIQDPLDYETRTHHSSADTFDHLRADDLRQAAVILASVLWSAANSDKVIPAMPLPTEPAKDPFQMRDARDDQ